MTIVYDDILYFLLCFVRILGIFMLTPLFSEREFLSQAKACLAGVLTLFIMPLVIDCLPNVKIMSYEMYVFHLVLQFSAGLMIGLCSHILFMVLDLVGHLVGFESGLSNAQTLNPSMGISSPLSTTILMLSATLLLFTLDFHHTVIRVLIRSFDIFDFSSPALFLDYHALVQRGIRKMFMLGLQLSFPFVIVGLVLNMAVGLINKLIPQIQIFNIMQPIQLLMGIVLLYILIAPLMNGFSNLYKTLFTDIFEASRFF